MGWLGKVASGAASGSVLLAGCSGGGEPTLTPLAEDPDATSAGGPVDGCRPAVAADDPHPDPNGGTEHPAFAGEWDADTFRAFLEEHTDVLADIWPDDEAGELVVMVPGPEGMQVFERLRQDAPEPDRVVCMEATYTRDELHLLMNRVDERLVATGRMLGSTINTVRNRIDVEFEGELADAEEALGDLADAEGVHLVVPECARVSPTPEGATALPGDGSNCRAAEADRTAVLAGDPTAGCAWMENEAGEPTTVLWPRGWSITEDGTVLDQRGEPRASIGDLVDSDGRYAPLAQGQRACGLGGDLAWTVRTLDRADDGAGSGEG